MTVGLAALAALCVGMASAAQHHATQQVDLRHVLHPSLVAALVRRPWWLLGTVASVVGLGLQATALAFGSIAVVQTVMITSLGWTAAGESLFDRQRPDPLLVAGVGLIVAGVVGFLTLLSPRLPLDLPEPSTPAVWGVVAVCATVGVCGLVCGLHGATRARASGLATATGVGYGLTAALVKLVGEQVRDGGWRAPLHHPALYAAATLGPTAVLLSQNTLQHGQQASSALALVMLLDVLVGVGTGVFWFGERIATDASVVAGATACLVAAVVGVTLTRSGHQARADGGRRRGAAG